MITHKEKAALLVLEYLSILGHKPIEVKKCALNAVDNILKAFELADIWSMGGVWSEHDWIKVKEEIGGINI